MTSFSDASLVGLPVLGTNFSLLPPPPPPHANLPCRLVTIRNVEFLNNPARFTDVYRFRVTFECIAPLEEGESVLNQAEKAGWLIDALDLEWKLIYVSCPGQEDLDQELDDCLVGPEPAVDPTKIPTEDVLGVAALILTGSYKDQEFVRVGYYQNTEYDNEEMKESPPEIIQFERLVRDISTKPRVTRFQIKWDAAPPAQVAAGAATSAAVPSADDLDDGMDEDKPQDGDTMQH
ncbi:anti-silence-domain-containing protein [Coprinellus micaceus]|uniref:Anti-silencing function protein 1 n=1 Tax=Coprinellus micaceus TaxID=71717 RepID=A0A4Y7TJZ0_COPMI|nr:anti-silence-domain-containing protein [Coprinellus micaceus]